MASVVRAERAHEPGYTLMNRLFIPLLAVLCSTALAATPPKPAVIKAATTAAATTVTASATLNWTAVTTATNGATITGVTYNVWDGNIAAGGTCTAGAISQVATGLTGLTDTLTLSGVTPGTVECFAVSASAGGQTGALSAIVPFTIPTPPAPIPGTTTVTVTIVIVSSP